MPLKLTDRRRSDTATNGGRLHPFRQHSTGRYNTDPQMAPSILVTLPPKPSTPAVPPRNPVRRPQTLSISEENVPSSRRTRMRSISLVRSSADITPSRSTTTYASVHRPPNLPAPSPHHFQRIRSASLSFGFSLDEERTRREPRRRATEPSSLVPPPLPPKNRHLMKSLKPPFPFTVTAKGKEM